MSRTNQTALQTVKGMRDLLPPETAVWAAVEATARAIFARYGYREIRTPILEETELFARGVGEGTDIVGKEMYSFEDKGGRLVTLRPENTAPVVRAYVEHGFAQLPQPVKLFYVGPQFRYERPQKGRYRQFHQIGAERFGSGAVPATADVEVLLLLVALLSELGFRDLKILVNTVGDEESRASYRAALVEFLTPLAERLGDDSRRRLASNPLRILDTKIPAERELLVGAPSLAEHLNERSRAHFEFVRSALDEFQVPYEVDPRLVRGLDYYTHTVFEIVSQGLGAQNAICGGGAYENLVGELGGADTYAVGFAIGEDRLVDVLPADSPARLSLPGPTIVALVGEVERGERTSFALAETLRRAGISAIDAGGKGSKAVWKLAEAMASPWVVFVGADELRDGTLTLRDTATREQTTLPREQAIARLAASYAR